MESRSHNSITSGMPMVSPSPAPPRIDSHQPSSRSANSFLLKLLIPRAVRPGVQIPVLPSLISTMLQLARPQLVALSTPCPRRTQPSRLIQPPSRMQTAAAAAFPINGPSIELASQQPTRPALHRLMSMLAVNSPYRSHTPTTLAARKPSPRPSAVLLLLTMHPQAAFRLLASCLQTRRSQSWIASPIPMA